VILWDPETREALVVDPGGEPERILEVLRANDLHPRMVLHTHAHIDHLSGTARIHEALGCEVALHPGDRFLHEHLEEQAAWAGLPCPPRTPLTAELRDGQAVRVGGAEAEILHTPGHSPGSICLYFPERARPRVELDPRLRLPGVPEGSGENVPLLLSGDTLFWGSIGRTDLWGGSYEEILRSIRERLLRLPDPTLVIPGHGPPTRLQDEKRGNPFLQGLG
jgi:glyoxylase-like metal-dependent hydrolase (beta-lactamase superfamily II)